jgi:glucose-1-phosphate thymidylyltransferase
MLFANNGDLMKPSLNTPKKIIGIIPAAGAATRLQPYFGAKEALPIGSQLINIHGKMEERPKIISQYAIEAMIDAGAQKILMIINQNKIDLMKYYGNGSRYGIDICYIFQEKPMGMAHALYLTHKWLDNATVLMGMPDTVILPGTCFKQLLQSHHKSKAIFTLGLFETDKPYKFGMIKTDGKGNITYHKDKPKDTDATQMWGIVCWSPEFTKYLSDYMDSNKNSEKEIVLGDIFDAIRNSRKPCKAFPIEAGKYYDIGTYDDLKRAINELN